MKHWNWEGFWFIFLVCCMGVCSNQNIDSIKEGIIIAVGFGTLFGLVITFVTKEEK